MRTPRPEPYFNAQSSLASGRLYIIGPDGDEDPQHALEQVVISNTGTTALRVAADVTGVQGTSYTVVPAGTQVPLEGPYNSLVFKTNTAAASTFSVAAMRFYRNATRDGGVKDSLDSTTTTRRRPGRLSFTANATTVTSVTLKQRATITAIKLYAGTAPATGTITLAIADSKGRNLLSAATFDLTSLVGGTLTTLTLTTSTDLLTVPAGETLTFTIVSNNGGATCVTAFEVAYTEA